MILFIFRLLLTVWMTLAFRLTLGPKLAIAGVQPDLMAGLVFYLTLSRGGNAGIVAGFLLGLLVDVDRPEGLGVSSLAWSTMALFTAWLREAMDASDPIVAGLLLFLSTLVAESIRALCVGGPDLGRFIMIFLRWALPTAIYTGVGVPLLVAGGRAILRERRWLGGRP
jgi:rod shape-determining protein MreD